MRIFQFAAMALVAAISLGGCGSTGGTSANPSGTPSVVAQDCAMFQQLQTLVPVAVSLVVDMAAPEAAIVRVAEGVVAADCSAAGQAQIASLISQLQGIIPHAQARRAARMRRAK